MAMCILAVDLGKAKSVACWYQEDGTHEFRTVRSRPRDFHDLLIDRKIDRVVIEICDMSGWVADLCRMLGIPIQVANAHREGWRWKNGDIKGSPPILTDFGFRSSPALARRQPVRRLGLPEDEKGPSLFSRREQRAARRFSRARPRGVAAPPN